MRAAVIAALALGAALAGCSFDDGQPLIGQNTCALDGDCTGGARCHEGLCVKRDPAQLEVTLEVTPTRLPDGSRAIPLLYGPFPLDGGAHRTFELPLPVTVTGTVRDGEAPLPAQLRFVPAPAGALYKPITASTPQDTGDFSVQLVSGMRYRLTILPNNAARPPHVSELSPVDGSALVIDYAQQAFDARTFLVQGYPTTRPLVMRAVDKRTGEPVSSTADVALGAATLVFRPDAGAFRLELRSSESLIKSAPAGTAAAVPAGDCDTSPPRFPVLRVDDDELRRDEGGFLVVNLPKVPEPVRYEGTVVPCDDKSGAGLGVMPMALDATELSLTLGPTKVSATYNAATSVRRDEASGELRFCVEVLPGEYVVVVTPPANLVCGIFAERRSLASASAPDLLALPQPAVLAGAVESPAGEPLAGAVLDALALGRMGALELPGGDPSVPSYNRTKQTTTDEMGRFRFPVDLGSYDVVVKPPAQSGFAWQVFHDVEVPTRTTTEKNVTLTAPALLDGTLRYAGAGGDAARTLAGAEVRAYTVLGAGTDGQRSIEIDRATASDDGDVMLLISPTLRAGF